MLGACVLLKCWDAYDQPCAHRVSTRQASRPFDVGVAKITTSNPVQEQQAAAAQTARQQVFRRERYVSPACHRRAAAFLTKKSELTDLEVEGKRCGNDRKRWGHQAHVAARGYVGAVLGSPHERDA